MRGRLVLALIALALAVTAFGVYGVVIATDGGASPEPTSSPQQPRPAGTFQFEPSETSPSPETPAVVSQPAVQVEGPQEVAARYLTAWQAGDLTTMAGLVSAPPADFAQRHRRFDSELRIAAPPALTQGAPRQRSPLEAEVPFHGTRQVEGLGPWPFSSVLRLVRHAGLWRIRWTPQTMHPSLGEGRSLRLTETSTRSPATLTREGQPFPQDSRAGDYFTGLDGTATELKLREVPSGRVLLSSPTRKGESTRTTISRDAQSAAAHALDGLGTPAALVAIDLRTRQVRAVADTLGGRRAFNGLYPPGSTFKVVTAAALLRSGLTPQSPVPCPGSYTIPNARGFTNADPVDHGVVPLSTAFALSCNTTFVQQTYERLRDGGLRAEAADRFGFREKPGLSSCRIRAHTDMNELGSDAIGQNSVQASPLCMAEVAAAAATGVWRPAVMTERPPADSPPEAPIGEDVAAGLRDMMGAVVTQGTAAGAGLPSGTRGKTGTAEVAGGRSHAWFIGYRGSLAFAVFVQNGGSGGAVAAPVAARFLNGLR